MRGKIMFIFVLASLVMSFTATTVASDQPSWISFNGTAVKEKPSAVAQQSNEMETLIEFQLKGLIVDEVVEDGETFQTLRFPHYYTTLEVGMPQLPAITETVGIPGSADVRVSVVDSTVVTLEGYKVYPFQTPLLEEEERVRFDINRDFYAQNVFYPENVVEISKPKVWRDIRIVNLRVYPIQYNPASGKLKVYQRLTVKLEYFGISKINVRMLSKRSISPHYEKMYRRGILNYDRLNLSKESQSVKGSFLQEEYDYLIIAVDQFVDEVGPLQTWKDSKGIPTQIIPLSTIGATPTANDIKDYITQEYNDHKIEYVLLVGDIDDLLSYEDYPCEDGYLISDYWYALLEGDDSYPEIAVGRFSSTSGTEVTNMVNKTINFEDNPVGDWLDKALLIAHKEDAPGKYQGCSERIKLANDTLIGTYRAKYPVFNTAYGASGSTNQNVIDAIDEGRVVVSYRGHGLETSWKDWNTGNEYFLPSNVESLNNGNKTPVIFSIACSNNALDEPICLGEAFTKAEEAAVAFLGASRPSDTNVNQSYAKYLYEAIFDAGIENICLASNYAASKIIESYGFFGKQNARMYLWLGDPSLAIPLEPDPLAYHWLILIDVSGSMEGVRLETAKSWATEKVVSVLADPDDMVALYTFNQYDPFKELLDWTRDEEALFYQIQNLSTGANTPLAEAACAAADKLISDVPEINARRILLLSDGDENWSTGECFGPSDSGENPPWCDDEDSWQCLVWDKLVSNLTLDVGYFGSIGTIEMRGYDVASASADSFELFLEELAEETGGRYYDPVTICGNGSLEEGEQCDVGYPCGATDSNGAEYDCINCQCVATTTTITTTTTTTTTPQIPTLTEWGIITLVLLLLAAGVVTIIRKRRVVAE